MEPLYNVYFAGQLVAGQELQDVRQKVQKLFNANPETLDKLFSGKTQLVKRGCDEATAIKYQQAIKRAGAKAIVQASEASPVQSTPAVATATTPTPPPNTQQAALDLAPSGGDILRPEERATPITREVDTSALELTAPGTTLSDAVESSAQAPNTSHLSMGEVGEDIPTLADTRVQLNPNIDGINLSCAGSDFSDCAAPQAEPLTLDLSSIEMAPVGSDVLAEEYKKPADEKVPDTDHIKLVD